MSAAFVPGPSGHNLPPNWTVVFEGWVTQEDVKRWKRNECPACKRPKP